MRWGRMTPRWCPWRSRSPSCRPLGARGSLDRGSETHSRLGHMSSIAWPWYAIVASLSFRKIRTKISCSRWRTKILMLCARWFFKNINHLSIYNLHTINHINHQAIKRFCWLNISFWNWVLSTVLGLKRFKRRGEAGSGWWWWPNSLTQSANNPHLIVLKPLLVCFRSEKNVIMETNLEGKDINYCSLL